MSLAEKSIEVERLHETILRENNECGRELISEQRNTILIGRVIVRGTFVAIRLDSYLKGGVIVRGTLVPLDASEASV